MYYLHQEINVASGSVSAFSRNLSLFQHSKGLIYAATVHKQQVNSVGWDPRLEGMTQDVIHIKDPSGPGTKPLTAVQAKYVTVPNRANPILIVCTSGGLLVFEWNGSTMLLWHSVKSSSEDANENYCLGIASMGDTFCTGTSSGDLLVFSAKGNVFKLKMTVSDHKAGIVDVCANAEMFISASHDGVIVSWGDGFKARNKISTGHPLNCVATYKNDIIVGTALGLMLIYQEATGELLVEIAAHARCIHSIDVLPDTGLMLSASEDSFVRVWTIERGKETEVEIECLQSECVKNTPLMGGVFLSPKADSFVVTGFDYPSIFYFKKKG